MKNNQKVIIVSIALVGLGMYYFYKQGKQDAQPALEPTSPFGDTKNIGTNTSPVKANWDKVLKKGSVGQEVGILQTALKTLKVDNSFGSLTEARLKKVMGVSETSLNNYNKFINKK